MLKKLLRYDPEERITARHGLLSPYFEDAPERTGTVEGQNGGGVRDLSQTMSSGLVQQNSCEGSTTVAAAENTGSALPPINGPLKASARTQHMKPYKFKPKNYGLHSTITGGFGGGGGNSVAGSGHYMNATMHNKSKFLKKSSMRN